MKKVIFLKEVIYLGNVTNLEGIIADPEKKYFVAIKYTVKNIKEL